VLPGHVLSGKGGSEGQRYYLARGQKIIRKTASSFFIRCGLSFELPLLLQSDQYLEFENACCEVVSEAAPGLLKRLKQAIAHKARKIFNLFSFP
jgi:hypothetical protein